MTHKLSDIGKGRLIESIDRGDSFREAGRRFNVVHSTAKRIYDDFYRNRAVVRKSGSSKKKKVSPRMKRSLIRYSLKKILFLKQ